MVSSESNSVATLFGPPIQLQTYKNLLYLLLAVPLGFLYAFVLTFGLVLGLLLFVVGIGIVILVATLFGLRAVAGFERALANVLLGVDLSAYDDISRPDGRFAGLRSYLDAASTWRAVGFVQLKFLIGVVGFLVVFAFVSAVQLLAAPIRYPTSVEFGELNDDPVVWSIDSLPEALGALAVGLIALIVVLHVANAVAYVAERMAEALLGEPSS
ncbi:sensor domain-containing protein [Halovivax gelatinilyticus]|uniref:sensor domain-containing protein n=1 Tax=Halovivax gelatinilyticus TaxID=2961597 RepID=UPI0020CA8158|nr:sensor domain-containing protein [Halovivax gelatinilyticus]